MLRFSSGLLGAISLAVAAAAQDIDMTALEADIDARSSQYDQLIGILQGTDANRSLAAFDAMVETGNPTMIEVAVNTGLMATDSRLRARALWEALSRKDAITITVDTSGLTQEEKTSLNEWNGAVQTDLAPVSPDTQAVAVWAVMNSRGERIFSPECGWLSL